VVSPLKQLPSFAEVTTADTLQVALHAGTAHIVLSGHIDMTELTARGEETQLPLWTDSIRVRGPPAAAPGCRVHSVAAVLTEPLQRFGKNLVLLRTSSVNSAWCLSMLLSTTHCTSSKVSLARMSRLLPAKVTRPQHGQGVDTEPTHESLERLR
jgi:hypothetical protein